MCVLRLITQPATNRTGTLAALLLLIDRSRFPSPGRYISSALLKSAAAAKAAAAAAAAAATRDGDEPSSPHSTVGGAEREAPGGGESREKEEGEMGDGGVLNVPPPPESGIRRLLLAGNQRLGAAGARALASALERDRSLQVLDLTRYSGGDAARILRAHMYLDVCVGARLVQ